MIYRGVIPFIVIQFCVLAGAMAWVITQSGTP
jgi:hypothetical protein